MAYRFWILGLLVIGAVAAPGGGKAEDLRPAKALQDNSFLIEEAYNQEPGIVHHVLMLQRRGRDWNLAFTQEWPLFGEAHQISYSIPYARLRANGAHASGAGDIFFNYRYQFWTETDPRPAFAPRFSFILPSGDRTRGLGQGSLGMQLNLPFSKIVGDRVTLHANAGYTRMFDIEGLSTNSYHLGGGLVYATSRTLNFMIEGLQEWSQGVEAGAVTRAHSFTLSPGIRYAFNLDAGQFVLGAGAPIVFTRGARTSYGAILYLSFEHSFLSR